VQVSSTVPMKTLAALALLAVTIVPATARAQTAKAAADLTGKWDAQFTRTAPDGRTQTIPFVFDLTQKGEVLTGTISPDADRVWPIEKGGAVKAGKVTFWVQQPDGPKRSFTLELVKDRLQGEMLAELNGQSFTVKVDAGRAK